MRRVDPLSLLLLDYELGGVKHSHITKYKSESITPLSIALATNNNRYAEIIIRNLREGQYSSHKLRNIFPELCQFPVFF